MSCCHFFNFPCIYHGSQAARLYRCFNGIKEREADEEAKTISITLEAEAADGALGVPGTASVPGPARRQPTPKSKSKPAKEKTWEQKARAEPCMKFK